METSVKKQQTTIQNILQREDVQKKIEKMIGNKTQGFITSVLQIVTSNDLLSKADPMSIYNGAMMAAALDLPLNNNLGFSYLVPFNVKQKDGSSKVLAQFLLGYKGFLQLAQRSGQYKNISATQIYDGQLTSSNPLTGFEFDFNKRASGKVVGYAAYIKLVTGFEKTLYMTKEEVIDHAKKYSKTYGRAGSAWMTAEDDMCCKTVLKRLISKFGPMSVDIQKADEIDEAVAEDIKSQEEVFADAVYVQPENEREELLKKIEQYNTAEELEILKMSIDPNVYQAEIDLIEGKIEVINTKNTKKK